MLTRHSTNYSMRKCKKLGFVSDSLHMISGVAENSTIHSLTLSAKMTNYGWYAVNRAIARNSVACEYVERGSER